ncbi:MAG: tripartite tricarboxylate transporter substrate binding protein [Treponemataceae bacterium]|nr:tripartite tricarboxylate transporter substrate binding protein [Treponemataceae bacterium]MDE7392823.1 tripartite tricarboxylate transporter substrate binding protein [Treponemataceae bacterium]
MKKISVVVFCIALGLVVLGSCKKNNTQKTDFPEHGITVICPWGEGGGTDAVLRALCKTAEKYLGTTITVENKTGGAGAIGHAAIKDARPDGYTLGMITFELNSLPPQKLINFTYADYDPIIRVNADAATLTVNADAPYNTVQEFVDYCKAHPGEVSIGNSAPGSVWHIGAGLLADATGIIVNHIPFEGAPGAVSAVASGQIEAVTVSLPEVKSELDAGNVKVLGIMASERPESYPDIKTFTEQGFDIEYATWRGLALPKHVNPAIKAILVDAFTQAATDPEFLEECIRLNLSPAYQNPVDFTVFLKHNYNDVAKTMKSIGLIE